MGGLRVLKANHDGSELGVFTSRPETLTNDFFVNVLDLDTTWEPTSDAEDDVRGPRPRDGRGQVDGQPRRPRVRVELPAARARRGLRVRRRQGKFVGDFVAAWAKVMNLDRFDID